MNIILASGIFKPELGGPANYVPQLAEELIKLGHRVVIISYSDQERYNFDSKFSYPVIRVKRVANIFLNYYLYFRVVLKEADKYDLIYTFDYFSAGIPSLLVAKLKGKKFVIRNGGDLIWERYLSKIQHGVNLKDYYKKKLYRKNLFKFIVAKIFFKLTDLVIFTTSLQGELFKKYYKIDDKKVEYINNPLPAKVSYTHKNKKSKEIIWAGRMVAKNNLIRLINVFCSLGQQEYKLVLIGEGDLKNNLRKLVKNKNCQQVVFVDKMSQKSLRNIIANNYAMIFPSYTDISPNTVLDCLAVGTPFILTQEHGFDWLRGKVIEFNPTSNQELKQALIKLMDKNFSKNFLDNLSKINYQYSFNQVANDTIKIFKQLK